MCASVVFITAYRSSFYMLNPAWWQGCSPLKRPPPGRAPPADIQRGEEAKRIYFQDFVLVRINVVAFSDEAVSFSDTPFLCL